MITIRAVRRSLLLAASLAVASFASAQVTITTNPPWNGSDFIYYLGELEVETFGQTFVAPAGSPVMQDFSFWVRHEVGNGNGGPTILQGFVMSWDGTKAGSSLFASSPYTVTQSASFEKVTFNVGNVALTPGSSYVAFLSASNVFDGLFDGARVGFVNTNPYANGLFVYNDNGSDFGALATTNWGVLSPAYDLAFEMHFTSAVPEPSTYGLFGAAALAGLIVYRRRRSLNRRAN